MNNTGLYNVAQGHNQVLLDIEFVKGDGSLVYDSEGQEYIDFYNNASLPLGHNNEIMRKVFSKNHPLNIGLYSTPFRKELVNLLSDIFPDYIGFQFYSSGTAANEGMLRYAMQITGRSSFCGFLGSFHGRSKAMSSVSDMDSYNGKRINGYFQLPYPGYDVSTGGYCVGSDGKTHPTVEELASVIDSHGYEDLAGMIIEPLLSKPVIELPSGWLRRVKEEVLEPRGILLLADEYLTSGRIGSWLETSTQIVLPDIFSFGKSFKTGFPFAGIACLHKYAQDVSVVKGGDTFGGQSAICENVLLTVQEILNQNLIVREIDLSHAFLAKMSDLVGTYGVTRVHAKGALFGIEFSSREVALNVSRQCLKQHVLASAIKRGMRLTPAFNISMHYLEEGLDRVCRAIHDSATVSL